MIYDLHIHSKYSYDSFLSPEKILKVAKRRGLDGVAITDHGTIKGGLEGFRINKNKDFEVIIGAEIKTEYGDVIGLFLNEEIKSNKFENVIDEIKSQGGMSILAHPYRQFSSPECLIHKVDMIEAFNARSKKVGNSKAHELSIKFNKPVTAGSDGHSSFEIGRGITLFDSTEDLLKGKTSVSGNESNFYLSHGLSVFNEKFKKVFSYLF